MITAIFDMDGTLINSANAICAAVNEIRSELGLTPLENALIMQIINTPGKDWAKELYEIENFSASSFKDGFEKYFIKHYQQSVILYEGVREILEFLKSKNAFLAIATNAPQGSLATILKQHDILPYFNKVLGVSLGIEPKPSPVMLNLIKDESPFKTCVFIGDSDKDRHAALSAKMSYYHAKWGFKGALKEDEFSDAKGLLRFLKKHMNES